MEQQPQQPLALAATSEKRCSNECCGRTSSLRWIKCKYKNKQQWLCHLCASYLHLDHCCPFCDQIYKQGDVDMFDGKAWLECSTCLRWVHAECEEKNGLKNANLLYRLGKTSKKPTWYLCPDCCVKYKESGDFSYDLFVYQYSQLEKEKLEQDDGKSKLNSLISDYLLLSDVQVSKKRKAGGPDILDKIQHPSSKALRSSLVV